MGHFFGQEGTANGVQSLAVSRWSVSPEIAALIGGHCRTHFATNLPARNARLHPS